MKDVLIAVLFVLFLVVATIILFPILKNADDAVMHDVFVVVGIVSGLCILTLFITVLIDQSRW